MKLMLDCRHAAELLSRRHDEPLAATQQARLRLHLMVCVSCRTVADQFELIRQAMRRLHERHEDPPP